MSFKCCSAPRVAQDRYRISTGQRPTFCIHYKRSSLSIMMRLRRNHTLAECWEEIRKDTCEVQKRRNKAENLNEVSSTCKHLLHIITVQPRLTIFKTDSRTFSAGSERRLHNGFIRSRNKSSAEASRSFGERQSVASRSRSAARLRFRTAPSERLLRSRFVAAAKLSAVSKELCQKQSKCSRQVKEQQASLSELTLFSLLLPPCPASPRPIRRFHHALTYWIS